MEVAGLFWVKCPKLDLDEKMGSVLVVQADGKYITPHQVEAHSREPSQKCGKRQQSIRTQLGQIRRRSSGLIYLLLRSFGNSFPILRRRS